MRGITHRTFPERETLAQYVNQSFSHSGMGFETDLQRIYNGFTTDLYYLCPLYDAKLQHFQEKPTQNMEKSVIAFKK